MCENNIILRTVANHTRPAVSGGACDVHRLLTKVCHHESSDPHQSNSWLSCSCANECFALPNSDAPQDGTRAFRNKKSSSCVIRLGKVGGQVHIMNLDGSGQRVLARGHLDAANSRNNIHLYQPVLSPIAVSLLLNRATITTPISM
jgi:hypothetical protein